MFDDSSSQLPHAAFLSKGVFMMQPTEDRLSPDLTSIDADSSFSTGAGPYP
jgi:hypothetical protein